MASESLTNSVVSIATAIVGLALVAVIFGTNSKTATVIQAGGSALAQDISAAVSPVTGGGFTSGLSLPTTF